MYINDKIRRNKLKTKKWYFFGIIILYKYDGYGGMDGQMEYPL